MCFLMESPIDLALNRCSELFLRFTCCNGVPLMILRIFINMIDSAKDNYLNAGRRRKAGENTELTTITRCHYNKDCIAFLGIGGYIFR